MAKPTSAFFRAGPSLVPSPVTATTCLCSIMLLSMMPGYIHKEKKTGFKHVLLHFSLHSAAIKPHL